MNIIKFWINNARAIALPQSVLPALAAVSLSLYSPNFNWWLTLIAFFGALCAHLGMNLADDWFDYKVSSGEKRKELASEGFRARVAKYSYLTSGQASVKQLGLAIVCFLTLAAACGAVVFYFRGYPILVLMLLGGFLGISYSGWPFRLCYRGYGELVIGIMFGPLLMCGMKYAACGAFDAEILIVSIAVGMLVTNILYSHSVMDAVPDAKMDKMTFARLMKRPSLMFAASCVFIFVPFVIVFAGVFAGVLGWGYCFVAALLPMAVYLSRSLASFLHLERASIGRTSPQQSSKEQASKEQASKEKSSIEQQSNEQSSREQQFRKEIKLYPWMGPMGDFDSYRKAGIDWFMLRWLLARNLLSFFCIIIFIVNVVAA